MTWYIDKQYLVFALHPQEDSWTVAFMILPTSVAHHWLVTSIDPWNLERLFLLQRKSVAPKKWLLDKWLELSQCFQPWNIKLSAGYASFCFTLKSSSLFLSSPATSHRSRTNNSLRTLHFFVLYLKPPQYQFQAPRFQTLILEAKHATFNQLIRIMM